MSEPAQPLDLKRVKVYPLAQRESLSSISSLLVDPQQPPAPCPAPIAPLLKACIANIDAARKRQASVMLIYGAHLIKNGAQRIVNRLIAGGWLTHLATNGAG